MITKIVHFEEYNETRNCVILELIFVTVKCCVSFAVRSEFLNII
jgi:hypothetical protein